MLIPCVTALYKVFLSRDCRISVNHTKSLTVVAVRQHGESKVKCLFFYFLFIAFTSKIYSILRFFVQKLLLILSTISCNVKQFIQKSLWRFASLRNK